MLDNLYDLTRGLLNPGAPRLNSAPVVAPAGKPWDVTLALNHIFHPNEIQNANFLIDGGLTKSDPKLIIAWSSSNESIFTINPTGTLPVLTPHAVGSAKLTLKLTYTGTEYQAVTKTLTATIDVTERTLVWVTPPPATGVTNTDYTATFKGGKPPYRCSITQGIHTLNDTTLNAGDPLTLTLNVDGTNQPVGKWNWKIYDGNREQLTGSTTISAPVAAVPDMTGADTSHVYEHGTDPDDYQALKIGQVGEIYLEGDDAAHTATILAAVKANAIRLEWSSEDVKVATVAQMTGTDKNLYAVVTPVATGRTTIHCKVYNVATGALIDDYHSGVDVDPATP